MSRCALFGRLAQAERVVQISAPAGSGKTVLLRSWIAEAGLARHTAWVPVDSEERDPQRFWLSVLGALRETSAGVALVGALTAAPDLDGWAIVERLLMDLAPLADRIWLVIDDVHELGPDALRQLELLIMRAPPGLRFVLATKHDVRLGLHRLRLEGELTEIREPNLRFTVAEARELFAAAGVQLPDSAVVMLHERTEGWAAGLRLAALSLAGHPDPARFAAAFSGTDRTVAEYLLAEVLDRQREEVRRLLLRTSILERVNGELADLLTEDKGGERVLQDLEQANAFVVSLDGSRSWFRYHQMFAGLLQLELRRAASDEVAALHRSGMSTFPPFLMTSGFHPDAVYRINIDNDGDAEADRAFSFVFSELEDGRQTGTAYYATDSRARQAEPSGDTLIRRTLVGFDASATPVQAGNCRLFIGVRSDPFFGDPEGYAHGFHFTGQDAFANKNVLSIALEVPNHMLFGAGPAIGVWATVSLRRDGQLVQVERDGHPSINPLMTPNDAKDEYNARQPVDDVKNYLKPWSEILQDHGYPPDEATAAVLTVLPDILRYDSSRPAAYPNGRLLTDDPFSAAMAFLTHGQVTSSGLRPHDDLLAQFPFLGLPNSLPAL